MSTHHPDEKFIPEGTRISARGVDGVCNGCDADAQGWDILVLPDDPTREPFWIGSRHVTIREA